MEDYMSLLSYAHGAATEPLLGETIGANLRRTAARVGYRDALVDVPSGQRWTYHRLDSEVDSLARGLLALGVAKGERVGIWAPNVPEWVLVQYATARIGAILVNINPAYRTHELKYVVEQAGISVLVATETFRSSDYRAMIDEIRPQCTGLSTVVYIGSDAWARLFDPVPTEALAAREAELSFDDPINIQYTSGTTGFPKGATLSHHNILN